MRGTPVPVTSGSSRFETIETAGCRVTHAWFPPGTVLHPHTHDRTILSVMIAGSFDTAVGGRRLECTPATVWTEPVEEKHANYVGRRGAEVVVVQPDHRREDLFSPFGALLDGVVCRRSARLLADAHRLVAELATGDALRGLAVDALVTSMMVTASRQECAHPASPPAWLRRVREALHETFRSPPTLAELAAVAGVSAAHVCHAFRRHYGTTVGEYVREIRMRWAAERLVATGDAIATIAAAAGYADHSHFARECRRRLGAGPTAYRSLHSPTASSPDSCARRERPNTLRSRA